jgi:hypothetical protein
VVPSDPRGRAARAMHDFFSFENLRNPARNRRAGLMCQFCPIQVYSTAVVGRPATRVPRYSSTTDLNLLISKVLNLSRLVDILVPRLKRGLGG